MTETQGPFARRFDAAFRQAFRDLVLWRRDVRRFRRDPVDPVLIQSLLELASHAPSVGHCQPWRFVLVESPECREAVRSSFVRANAKALENYAGEQRAQYARLKLEGLQDAPVHLAVFADEATEAGSGLGFLNWRPDRDRVVASMPTPFFMASTRPAMTPAAPLATMPLLI